MFNVAMEMDVVASDPVTTTRRPGSERQRDRVLTRDEDPHVLDAGRGAAAPDGRAVQTAAADGVLITGGEGQNRTADTTIFSRMLYQLSYLATVRNRVQKRPKIIPRARFGSQDA